MKKFNINELKLSDKEEISLSEDNNLIIGFSVLTHYIIDQEYHVFIAPSLAVSGYGSNKNEAEKSFQYNLSLFIDSFNESSNIVDKTNHLIRLGWIFNQKGQKIRNTPPNLLPHLNNSTQSLYSYA